MQVYLDKLTKIFHVQMAYATTLCFAMLYKLHAWYKVIKLLPTVNRSRKNNCIHIIHNVKYKSNILVGKCLGKCKRNGKV